MHSQFLNFAKRLADQAAQISQHYFRQQFKLETKTNLTPVTQADREIELALRALIKQHYPKHAIIGEEFALHPGSSQYCWVLDPIDGTVAFACGKPIFTTLIALLEDGEPILSIIDQPIMDERFTAWRGQAACLNDMQIRSSSQQQLASARLNITTPLMFITPEEQQVLAKVCRQVRMTSFGGDAYAYGLLAAGHIDAIVEADLHYYDVAALIPLVEASGGVISDWQGQPLTPAFKGQCLAAANSELQQQLLSLINN